MPEVHGFPEPKACDPSLIEEFRERPSGATGWPDQTERLRSRIQDEPIGNNQPNDWRHTNRQTREPRPCRSSPQGCASDLREIGKDFLIRFNLGAKHALGPAVPESQTLNR